MKLMAQKEMRIEDMKRQLNDKYKQRKNMHNMEIKIKMARMDEKEREVFICFLSKECRVKGNQHANMTHFKIIC